MVKKTLFRFFFLSGLMVLLALFFAPHLSFAQNPLPAGGEAIGAATPLPLGDYSNYSLPDGAGVFYLIDEEILPGQEIRAKVLFSGETNLGLFFYDQDYQKLTGKEYLGQHDNLSLFWLNGSQESQKYYLYITNQAINEANLGLVNVEVVDRFDADSKTDAGGSLDEALPIELGQYTGFLDFGYEVQDREDFYQINLGRGQNLTVKATPPQGLYLDLAIYDQSGNELVGDSSQNAGAAITGSIRAEKAEAFYVLVAIGDYDADQSGAGQYKLSLTGDLPDEGKAATANLAGDDDSSLTAKPLLGNIGGLVVLILVTVLVIIGATVFLLTKKKGPEEPSESKEKAIAQERQEVKKEAVYCSACGTENNPGSKFCSKCGQELI